ncbi:hypothetical protein D3C77_619390 [compost metagenome]
MNTSINVEKISTINVITPIATSPVVLSRLNAVLRPSSPKTECSKALALTPSSSNAALSSLANLGSKKLLPSLNQAAIAVKFLTNPVKP